jgi:hypothetical protein
MTDRHRLKWTAEQLAQMQQDRAAGLAWNTAALRCGHPESSCRQMMSRINGQRYRAASRAAAPHVAAPVISPVVQRRQPAPVSDPPYSRSTSTAMLVADAELRSRIAVLGITGGLLGDPEPGRSALDRRKRA